MRYLKWLLYALLFLVAIANGNTEVFVIAFALIKAFDRKPTHKKHNTFNGGK